MAFPDRRTMSVLLTTLLFGVALAIVYIARAVIVIFVFSILFAYLINPIVKFLQRHSLLFRNLRGPHVAEAYLALLFFIALIAHLLAPGYLSRSSNLIRQIPVWSDRIATGEIATDMGGKYGWNDTQTRRLKTFLVQHRYDIQNAMGATQRFATVAIGAVVVIPILSIFFLSDGENLANQVIHLVSTKDNYAVIRSLADELNVMLHHYIRAKVILGGLSFGYASIGMLILDFPHALALGVLAGILEFIPIAGWMIAATTIITFGILSHCQWIWMAALLGVWRMLIDYWIAPRVMGRELEIHPLLAIFTLMAGGAVGGFAGVYLSLPIVAALRVVWRRFASAAPTSAGTTDQLPASEGGGRLIPAMNQIRADDPAILEGIPGQLKQS
jgi:predicted PurR-regulated permease PerM